MTLDATRHYSRPLTAERLFGWHASLFPTGPLYGEMNAFLDWFHADTRVDDVLKAALAHLWFVTLHPFDDGSGPQRFHSMSAQIRQERSAYYDILKQTTKGTMHVTPQMAWFLGCLGRAIDGARATLEAIMHNARLWDSLVGVDLDNRQRLVLNRLVDGFEGKLTTSKHAKLAKCAQDSALRDIRQLVERGSFVRNPERGRSTS